jgi:predicted DsbA family dithiol-disulfide isomerase
MADFGWNSTKVDAVIADESIAKKVQDEIKHFQKMGVTGVPFFIINNKYGISGAQPSSAFLEAFEKVGAREMIADGDTCDPETGNC